jgi:hypothetical protein
MGTPSPPLKAKYLVFNVLANFISAKGKNILDTPSPLVHHWFAVHYW